MGFGSGREESREKNSRFVTRATGRITLTRTEMEKTVGRNGLGEHKDETGHVDFGSVSYFQLKTLGMYLGTDSLPSENSRLETECRLY